MAMNQADPGKTSAPPPEIEPSAPLARFHEPTPMVDPADPAKHVPNLKLALRGARVEEAERAQGADGLRGMELARLEMLRDEIEPVLAQVPSDIDLFDAAILPGLHPRLFIDMLAFVEMGHDKRVYRFVRTTRHGRVVLAETDQAEAMAEAITAYIARRLVDREKALDAEPAREVFREAPVAGPPPPPVDHRPPPRGQRARWVERAVRLLLDYAGILALCVLAWVLVRAGYAGWPVPPR